MLTTNVLIKDCIIKLNENINRVESTFSFLPLEQVNWKPAQNVWSIGECISHLITTNELYFNKMNESVRNRGAENAQEIKYYQSFWGKILAKAVDPEKVKKVKTFNVFMPSQSSISKSITGDYRLLTNQLIELVKTMNGINLRKIRISSPVSKLIILNLGDPLIIIPKHDERHLNQAEKLLKNKNFPL